MRPQSPPYKKFIINWTHRPNSIVSRIIPAVPLDTKRVISVTRKYLHEAFSVRTVSMAGECCRAHSFQVESWVATRSCTNILMEQTNPSLASAITVIAQNFASVDTGRTAKTPCYSPTRPRNLGTQWKFATSLRWSHWSHIWNVMGIGALPKILA